MTITEFLEARIAEDEKLANYYGPLAMGSARVLAECAAKRAILAFDQDEQIWDPRGSSADTAAEAFTRGIAKSPHARHVTRLLAAVYKDHPDYQQEWTP